MDNLGSEVGQKMRSAVKAKLLELGTGGSAGYIDDELPDYVMIMVANKRSKQQMIADLNLFLGSQTDLFVTWLHEVLQKLQEVTLPAVALQKKRKNSQKEEASSSKRDKREKKKDKKAQKKPTDQESEDISSITDVFAGEFLEKAKKTFEIDESGVQKDKKQESPTHRDETDDFDIPTITEISNRGTTSVPIENREKDLAELAEIQKKIYAAKKQLKILDDADESEDEDFLNIKEDGEEFDETGDLIREKKKPSKAKSPIVFDRNEEESRAASIPDSSRGEVTHTERSDPMADFSSNRHRPIEFSESSEHEKERAHPPKDKTPRKRSIHERLGHVSRGSEHTQPHRRAEKELYVPAFRRRELEKEKREKKSNGELDERHSRKRSNSREKHRQDNSNDRSSQHQRIGSRVVVAPPKPEIPSNDESDGQHPERPVNSVIKIKPRPSISPSKQACKNLLLRAVAEAQRSTILVKPKKDISVRKSTSNSSTKRNTKFFTKSYRDRIGRDALLRRTAKNLVIEVKADMRRQAERDKDEGMLQEQEEEYIPEIISDRGESDIEPIYVPQSLNMTNNEDEENGHEAMEDNSTESKTQFVVTLNDKNSSNYKSKSKSSRLNGIESKSRQTMNANKRDKVDIRSRLTLKTDTARNDRESNSSPSYSTPPRPSSSMSSSKKTELIKIYRKPKEIKKIVIKNDSEDEEYSSPKKESPNKLHIPKEEKRFSDGKELSCPSTEEEEGSTTPPLPVRTHDEKTPEITPNKRKRQLIKFDLSKQHKTEESVPAKRRSKSGEPDRELNMDTTGDERHKISTKNVESKKYDNLPSSLNSVSIDSLVIKAKPKERCKYYPSCTKDTCEFYHPAAPCKSFPNCKYADKCLYVHPKCKFDQTCNKIGCNFQHSASIPGQCSAPPLSSHVVPVQNYKSISTSAAPSMCKFYPNCSKPSCPFFHPKMCRFGRNCNNKLECNFYHHDVASNKFKWVASVV